MFWPRKGSAEGAHRVSWVLANREPIPPRMNVCHSCDNPPCVNPAHLWVGTSSDNHWDASRKGRIPGNRTTNGSPERTLDMNRVALMRDAGMSYAQIGAVLGVSGATVWRNVNT